MGSLSAILCLVLLANVQPCNAAQLTITPPSLTLSGNNSVGTVRFTCTPGTVVFPQALYSLHISRAATDSTAQPTPLGSASQRYNNNGAAWMDTTITGATIEGSLSQQSITITMTQATCTDEATFVCNAAVFTPLTASFPSPTEDRRNFTVDVSTGAVSMTAEPLEQFYLVNDTLTLRCNGLVGSNVPSVRIQWVWQYKDRTGFSYNDYVRSEDIMTEGMFQDVNNRCQYRQVSTLTRQITLHDSGREYRCFVRRNNVPSEPDSEHTASYSIGPVHDGASSGSAEGGHSTPSFDKTTPPYVSWTTSLSSKLDVIIGQLDVITNLLNRGLAFLTRSG